MKIAKLITGLTVCLALGAMIAASSASADFGFSSFSNTYQQPRAEPAPGIGQAGTKPPTTQAGSHADVVTSFALNTITDPTGALITDGQLKDVQTDLPAGFYGNPEALPTCTSTYLFGHDGLCQPAAQVGVLNIAIFPGVNIDFPAYNMASTTAQTAVIAADVVGSLVKINVSARTDGDYGLQANVSEVNQALQNYGTKLVLWGLPADHVNDPLRLSAIFNGGLAAEVAVQPFLSLPARCDGPLTTTLHADSWQNPGSYNPDGTIDLSDPNWVTVSETTPALTGCDKLRFAPSLKARPSTTRADSPSGLNVDLKIPQNKDPNGLSTPQLRRAEVTLPEGLVVNPSSANGLDACTPAQIGLNTAVGDPAAHFDKIPAACPDSAKIGTLELDTPVFEDALEGEVYLASPHQNPYGSLLSLYLVIEGRGLVIKIPGKLSADPETGRLTTTFDENPQLPFEDLRLKFLSGDLAPLRTPALCGKYSTTSVMTPWSAPDSGPPATTSDEYEINQGPGGSACATSTSALPNTPSFEAGTTNPIAGAYSPFALKLARADGTQPVSGIDATLPKGLLAKLAGLPPCSDAALTAAAQKTGKAEQASPSCPSASRVGSVLVGAGAGSKPFSAPGVAYLAGPYKGAPLSLAVVTPAVAGPFDLGTVVVRNRVTIDPVTAQVHAVSDPFPSILQGIPLDIRSIDLRLDRDQFTKNPTDCTASSITGLATSLFSAVAPLADRFQVGGCGELGFAPKLSLALKGAVHRRAHPSLRATLTARPGDANIGRAQVKLPKAAFLDNAHLGTPCTRVQFAAKACPEGSILGHASATSPLLDYEVSGNVILRSNPAHKLPDLVAVFNGPANQPIEIELAGKTDSVNGALRNTFEAVPDVPVTKFHLELFGGKKGLIIMSSGFCANPNATVKLTGQNGAAYDTTPVVASSCGKGKGKKKK